MASQEWLAEVERRIKISEGCSLTAYPDPGTGAQPWTIGYGHTGGIVVGQTITQEEADAFLERDVSQAISGARVSLAPGIFDRLSDARRFVLVDLVFNLGLTGWMGFAATRNIIAAAVDTKVPATAHALYGEAADHLEVALWFSQVGERAGRDVAMMRSSEWVDANGNGSS